MFLYISDHEVDTGFVLKLTIDDGSGDAQTRRFDGADLWDSSNSTLSFAKLTTIASDFAFKRQIAEMVEKVKVSYIDDDGEKITISSDRELMESFRQAMQQSSVQSLRIHAIFPKSDETHWGKQVADDKLVQRDIGNLVRARPGSIDTGDPIDDAVLSLLLKYENTIGGPHSPEYGLRRPFHRVSHAFGPSNISYSEKNVTEVYFSNILLRYPSLGGKFWSKYCSVEGAYIDLIPRTSPEDDVYSRKYIAIYFPETIINGIQNFLICKNNLTPELVSDGLYHDPNQRLFCMNCEYGTYICPYVSFLEGCAEDDEFTHLRGKNQTPIKAKLQKTCKTVEALYDELKHSGGALLRGYAFGAFGVSKNICSGRPVHSLRHSFKLIGFHVTHFKTNIRPINIGEFTGESKLRFGV